MLCGNKIDLRETCVAEGMRCVTAQNGERLAREHAATFLETSSKDGANVLGVDCCHNILPWKSQTTLFEKRIFAKLVLCFCSSP